MGEGPGSFLLVCLVWTSVIFVPLALGTYAIAWLAKKLVGLSLPFGLLDVLCLSASLTLAFVGAFMVPAFSPVVDSYAAGGPLPLITQGLIAANACFALWLPLAFFLFLLWRSKRKNTGSAVRLSFLIATLGLVELAFLAIYLPISGLSACL
jgi:hypothetical protein